MEIENYKEIYEAFIDEVLEKLDVSKLYSIFIWGLMYTHADYAKVLKKQPFLDVLYKLEKDNDGFYRENQKVREWFYTLFSEKIQEKKCNICLDTY